MNLIKRTLQNIVLMVNRWPFGLHFTRMPYYLAIRATSRLLEKYPLVTTAYARNSFALGVWVPGRSDIDLTLVMRSGETAEQELTAVNGFWKDYAALQRWFPMLGEVEILNEKHLEAWTRFAVTGYEARYWLLIYGSDIDRSSYVGASSQLDTDRLNHAISIYYHQMSPVIGSVSVDVLARYTKKILRYLDQSVETNWDEKHSSKTADQLQAIVIQALDCKVQEHAAKPCEGADLDLAHTLAGDVYPVVKEGKAPAWLSNNVMLDDLLETVLQTPGDTTHVYYIPRQVLDSDTLIHSIRLANRGQAIPIVMSKATFLHFLQHVNPMEYLVFLQNRTLLWGNDPLAQAAPCPEKVFHQAICAYAIHTLPFPYFQNAEPDSTEEFSDILLGWLLRTASYFDDRVIEFDYDRLLERWRLNHSVQVIENWQGNPKDPVRRFAVLRCISDCISSSLLRPTFRHNIL